MLTVASSRELRLELFPFISLFLCVIGVLAFLQNLLVMGDIGASEEEASQPQILQTAYRIECYRDKLVLHPPESGLEALEEKLTLEEKAALQGIVQQRTKDTGDQGIVLPITSDFDENSLRRALNEMVTINRLSAIHRYAYEEYVLLDIHSAGSDAYHYLRRLLDEPAYRRLRSGLDITDFSSGVE